MQHSSCKQQLVSVPWTASSEHLALTGASNDLAAVTHKWNSSSFYHTGLDSFGFSLSWDSVMIFFMCCCQPKSLLVEIRSLSICFFKTLKWSNMNGRILTFPCDILQGIWKNQTKPELRQEPYSLRRQCQFYFKFQFCPGAPRREKAMLQHYRWREANSPWQVA